MTKLLIICMGNICRSPMAKAVVQKLIDEIGLRKDVQVESAGTRVNRAGERMDPRAMATLARGGYNAVMSRSRKVTPQDFQKFDLILAMDSANLADLQRVCPPEHLSKLALFLSFATDLNELEVPDPYYGNVQGFDRVLQLCKSGAAGLLKHIQCQLKLVEIPYKYFLK